MMIRTVALRTLGTGCLLAAMATHADAQPRGPMPEGLTADPAAARVEVADLRRLAGALRTLRAGDVRDTAAHIRQHYLDHATPGLRAYVERYDVTGASIAAALVRQPDTFADLDALADRITGLAGEYRAALGRVREVYPDAIFPTTWFVAGHYGPGGMARHEGAIIAAERFADDLETLVPLAVHEVTHFLQAMLQGPETYQLIYGPGGTLLALALREGAAELVAELATGRIVNAAAHRYGLPREAELWARFQADMHGSDPGDWMFARPQDPAQPADLGYWIGYRIVRSYYDRATDREAALRDILGITDFQGFLEASGYGG